MPQLFDHTVQMQRTPQEFNHTVQMQLMPQEFNHTVQIQRTPQEIQQMERRLSDAEQRITEMGWLLDSLSQQWPYCPTCGDA